MINVANSVVIDRYSIKDHVIVVLIVSMLSMIWMVLTVLLVNISSISNMFIRV